MAQTTVRVSIKNYHLPMLDEYASELGIEPDYTEIINALLLEVKRDRIRGGCSCQQSPPIAPPNPAHQPLAPTNEGIGDDLFNELNNLIQAA